MYSPIVIPLHPSSPQWHRQQDSNLHLRFWRPTFCLLNYAYMNKIGPTFFGKSYRPGPPEPHQKVALHSGVYKFWLLLF